MSTTSSILETAWSIDPDLWRCVACGGGMSQEDDGLVCPGCGRTYPRRDGILVVKPEEQLEGNNQVVGAFYNSPQWPQFRFWEWLTFVGNGGERRCRNKVLRHLPNQTGLKLLDVAIGDGVYLDWLPRDWRIAGIDIATEQLKVCQDRVAGRDVPLVLGEAEELPFQDNAFDAVLSIGAFNYFNDPEGALREMRRVVRPGGTIVIADEVPNLMDRMSLGRRLGIPALDRWVIAKVTRPLGRDFTELVERHKDLDVAAIGQRVLPGCRYELIWQRLGYVLVGEVPEED